MIKILFAFCLLILNSCDELDSLMGNEDINLTMFFLYFGENRSAIIVSCHPRKSGEVIKIANKHNIDSKEIGVVTKNELIINEDIRIKVERLKSIFYNQSD